jgi:serine/threonine protein kinase
MAGDKDYYAFKYSTSSVVATWEELHMLARLPHHPSLALLDRLVLDELTGSHVVGFTMRYVAGKTLDKSRPPFKLRWLRQLMQVVVDLNLKHGVIHQDIAHRNLLIDSSTDSIILIDFDTAYRIGICKTGGRYSEGKW